MEVIIVFHSMFSFFFFFFFLFFYILLARQSTCQGAINQPTAACDFAPRTEEHFAFFPHWNT